MPASASASTLASIVECRDRVGRDTKPDRLVSQRRQHLLVAQQPFAFALDDEHSLAAAKRRRRRTGDRGVVSRRGGQPRFEAATMSRFTRTFIAPTWSRMISCTAARPRPVPAERVVKKGLNSRCATPSSKPRPVGAKIEDYLLELRRFAGHGDADRNVRNDELNACGKEARSNETASSIRVSTSTAWTRRSRRRPNVRMWSIKSRPRSAAAVSHRHAALAWFRA
jgi:hypothetical protein